MSCTQCGKKMSSFRISIERNCYGASFSFPSYTSPLGYVIVSPREIYYSSIANEMHICRTMNTIKEINYKEKKEREYRKNLFINYNSYSYQKCIYVYDWDYGYDGSIVRSFITIRTKVDYNIDWYYRPKDIYDVNKFYCRKKKKHMRKKGKTRLSRKIKKIIKKRNRRRRRVNIRTNLI